MTDYNYMPTYRTDSFGYSLDSKCMWGYHPGGYQNPNTDAPTQNHISESCLNSSTCTVETTQYGVFLKCNVCNVCCTGQASFDQHLLGAQHRKNSRPQPEWNCKVCNLNFTDSSQHEAHVRGSRHARQLKRVNLNAATAAVKSPEAQATEYFRCPTCQLDCVSESQLQSHLSGRKHQRRLKQHLTSWIEDSQSTASSHTTSSIPMHSPPALDSSHQMCTQQVAVQTEADCTVERIRKLESTLNPVILSLPACYINVHHSDVLDKKQKALHSPTKTDTCPTPSQSKKQEVFCTHESCILARALQSYEKSLWLQSQPAPAPPQRRNYRKFGYSYSTRPSGQTR